MNTDLDRFEHFSKRSEWLKPIVETWRRNIDRYMDIAEGEHTPPVPYAGTERANISLLAGATWEQGGIALEEFSINRGSPNNPLWGRSDLWMTFNGHNLSVEAKMSWQNNSGHKDILRRLDRASEDVDRISTGRHNPGLALVFVTSKVSEKVAATQSMPDIIRHRLCWVDEYKNHLDIVAGHFPGCGAERAPKFPDTGGRTWYWPGVYMVGRVV